MSELKITGQKLDVVHAIVAHIQKHYAEDVSLMVCYGSAVTGPVTPLSDVDFFIVPKTEKGRKAAMQFVLDGIGYDLWCVSWTFLEDAASYKNPLTSLVDHGVVVYADESSSEEQFNRLKSQVKKKEKASELLKLVKMRLLNAQSKLIKIANNKHFDNDGYYELAEEVYYAVLYANQDYSLKGPINGVEELGRYDDLPDDIKKLYDIGESFDEKMAFDRAVSALVALENYVSLKTNANVPDDPCSLGGFYEELKSTYNKLYRACDEKNRWRTWVCLKMIDRDTHEVLGALANELPSLKGLENLAYATIREQVKRHENELVSTLITHGVKIVQFDTIDAFKGFLDI